MTQEEQTRYAQVLAGAALNHIAEEEQARVLAAAIAEDGPGKGLWMTAGLLAGGIVEVLERDRLTGLVRIAELIAETRPLDEAAWARSTETGQ